MRPAGWTFSIAMALLLLLSCGCCGNKGIEQSQRPDVPPPSYAQIREGYNRRAVRLDRIWGRAVVSLRWTEEDGERRYQQGDGHLQVIAPMNFALSVGKLGEVLFWFGSNEERYWFLDLTAEPQLAYVGRHGAMDRRARSRWPLPAAPHELLVLSGATPLPESAQASVAWTAEGLLAVRPLAAGNWRYFIEPQSWLPRRIELLDAAGEPLVVSDLEKYGKVDIKGESDPEMVTRARIVHIPSDSEMLLSLEMLRDRSMMGDIRLANFDLQRLVERYEVEQFIDLDAPPAAPLVEQ